MLGAQQECTIQFTAPASRALHASRWQRGMMVKPLQFINYAKAINALSKQLLMFGQPGPGAAPALSQRGWAPGEDPLSSRVNGSILWTSWMKGKKEREDGRALSPALGLFICAAPIHVCVCVCAGHTLQAHSAPIRQLVCRGDARKGEERCLLLRVETELEQLHVVPLPEGQPRHCSHTATRALMCSFTFLDASSPRGAKAQGVSISCSLTATHGWRAHFGN